jgi:phi13 family phage major tail protein
MTVNATEYRTAIGLDSVYIAEVTQDDSGGYVAGAPVYLAPAAELSGAPKTSEEIVYYDDAPYETLSAEGVTERKLKISGLPPEIEALITGEAMDTASGRMFDSATPANAPYFALGYRSMKSNGHYRYYWFLKGKFQKGGNEHATLGEKAEGKPVELTYNAIKTVYKFNLGSRTDGCKRVQGDQDTTNFSGTTWFDAVQTPVAGSAPALTCTPSPADAATGVSVSANVVLTFSNRIRSGNAGILVTKADGTVVAGAYSWDATYKVLTFDPTSNFGASGDYLVTLSGVTDIYGQTLANTVYNFTTA